MSEIEETLSGFKQKGEWADVVEHGERMAAAIRRCLKKKEKRGETVSQQREWLEEFEEWRPKVEDKNTEISERTAEQASVPPSESEQKGKSVRDDVSDAQEGVKEAVDSATQLETDTMKDGVGDSVRYTQRATDSFFRKTLRWIEEKVYKHIMTKVSPYYFDNQLVNANLSEHRDGTYTLEVNIFDDALASAVRDEVEEMEEKQDVWRIETDMNSSVPKDVEGFQEVSDTKTKEQLEDDVDREIEESEDVTDETLE